jgi:hypothetical protein
MTVGKSGSGAHNMIWKLHLASRWWLVVPFFFGAEQVSANPSERQFPAVVESNVTHVAVGLTKLTLDGCKLSSVRLGKKAGGSLDLSGNCQFNKAQDGLVRAVKVKDNFVFAVETSEPIPETSDCKTRIQGVIVSSRGIRLSSTVQNIAMCPPMSLDQKMFQVFAVRTKPL